MISKDTTTFTIIMFTATSKVGAWVSVPSRRAMKTDSSTIHVSTSEMVSISALIVRPHPCQSCMTIACSVQLEHLSRYVARAILNGSNPRSKVYLSQESNATNFWNKPYMVKMSTDGSKSVSILGGTANDRVAVYSETESGSYEKSWE